jgi:putative FmdB family regulatory protein
MPLYEYQCEACGERFEAIRKFSDPPLEVCEKCGKGPVQRLVSSPAFQFKGSGWYITDYAKKGSNSSSDTGTKETASPAKPESGSSDTSSGSTEKTTKTDTAAKPAGPSTSKE